MQMQNVIFPCAAAENICGMYKNVESLVFDLVYTHLFCREKRGQQAAGES
jgi:hypothetical protein